MTDHPITPPPELVQQWVSEFYPPGRTTEAENYVAIQAARWGADQELEACCKWLPKLPPWSADDLRRHRRPKPPSLKQQALNAACIELLPDGKNAALIIRALEALPDE